ncbi:hypothetical protein PIB30_086298 [Stylosanthes scabra]|uniref:Uncharacterized protein n=1 Tax=Stylosanthes scabra TaxID=79078 RepID=A0ABU6QTW7_9FABA|nr:hypothetical protein [Stylosanthes scabra]
MNMFQQFLSHAVAVLHRILISSPTPPPSPEPVLLIYERASLLAVPVLTSFALFLLIHLISETQVESLFE